ncbi:hypothetical protein HanHA89_Chr16g0685561 [Helianthus annuus]|nr:hypothetical protein HanHA89_Chr16g0685561 [Helianthus annuus]
MGQFITFTTQNNKQTRSNLLAVDGTDCPIDHQTNRSGLSCFLCCVHKYIHPLSFQTTLFLL